MYTFHCLAGFLSIVFGGFFRSGFTTTYIIVCIIVINHISVNQTNIQLIFLRFGLANNMTLPLFLSKICEKCKNTLTRIILDYTCVQPVSRKTNNVATRYRVFCTGGHMIKSEHMNCCVAAEKRFFEI